MQSKASNCFEFTSHCLLVATQVVYFVQLMFNATLSSIVCGRMAKIDCIPKSHSNSFFTHFTSNKSLNYVFVLYASKLVGVHSAFARTCDRFSCLTTREVAFPPSPSRLCALHLIEMFLLGHRSNSVNACLRS